MLTNSYNGRMQTEHSKTFAEWELRSQVPVREPVWIPAKVSLFSKIVRVLRWIPIGGKSKW